MSAGGDLGYRPRMWLLLLACAGPDPIGASTPLEVDPERDDTADTDDTDTDDTAETGDTGETGETAEPFVFPEQFDVIVVGAGPAGVAAALSAREAGASVLLLDREEEPGMGLITGGQAFAVGSRWQESQGIYDTIEAAQADWADITAADPDAPGVLDFLANSADTLEWLTGYGLAISSVRPDRDAGTTPRVHLLGWDAIGDGRGLYTFFDGEMRVGVEVTAPVMDGAAVVGVAWTDVVTGETGTSGARAVVLATGGFLRNRDEVDRVLPAVAGRRMVFEANYHSDGGGLPFLDAVGAARIAPEQIGIYVHSIRDPEMTEGESILAIGSESGILVGADGERFTNEELQRSFDLFDALPAGDVYAILAGELVDALQFARPAYNWASSDTPESIAVEDLLPLSDDLYFGDDPEQLAIEAGIDAEALTATIEEWNLTLYGGGVDPYGRNLVTSRPLEGEGWAIIRLTPGLAKNFGGVSTDPDAHVLDYDGVPIPGLYAAGEVAGMVLGGGGGDGFSGSVGACYWGGRVAGTEAAAFAAAGAR